MAQNNLTKEVLVEYGFKINEFKTKDRITCMYKDDFEVSVVDDGTIFHAHIGFAYPLDSLDALKKLYKQIKREDLEK